MGSIVYLPMLPARSNAAYPTSIGNKRYLDIYAQLHKDEIKAALKWWKSISLSMSKDMIPYSVGLYDSAFLGNDYSMGLFVVYPDDRYWTQEHKHKSPDLDCKLTQDAIFEFLGVDDMQLVSKVEHKYSQSEVNAEPGIYLIISPERDNITENWYGFNYAARLFKNSITREEKSIVCRTLARKQLSVAYHVVKYTIIDRETNTSKVEYIGFDDRCPIVAELPYDKTKILRFLDFKIDEVAKTIPITTRRWGSIASFEYKIVAGKGRVYQIGNNVEGIPSLTIVT